MDKNDVVLLCVITVTYFSYRISLADDIRRMKSKCLKPALVRLVYIILAFTSFQDWTFKLSV